MRASVEISMYPLVQEYERPILDFIQRLQHHPDIELHTNSLSTQLFGDYHRIMQVLTEEIATTFQQEQTTVMVLKILNVSID
ncbi:MAG: hypothetical protein KDC44_19910 [Phaeodactylibacter sp.]|nr:hypothetical protein [Phaeodactylibacter sp.]